jgi:hypothetical protein
VFGWGLIGAWIALVLDQYTRAAVVYFRFRSGKWKHMKSRSGVGTGNPLREELEDGADATSC